MCGIYISCGNKPPSNVLISEYFQPLLALCMEVILRACWSLTVGTGISWVVSKLPGWLSLSGIIVQQPHNTGVREWERGGVSEQVCSGQSLVKEPIFTQCCEGIRNFYPTRSCVEGSKRFLFALLLQGEKHLTKRQTHSSSIEPGVFIISRWKMATPK